MVAADRLKWEVEALMELTAGDEPCVQKCRAKESISAFYLVGDASGNGLGSGFFDEKGLSYDSANWALHRMDETSNFKEAKNLTKKVEEKADEGKLDDAELFVFTDNQVFEGTFYKGHSGNIKLDGLVLRLRKVERERGCIIHVIHIAGTRMKESGIDGLSRGDLLEGMMAGKDPLSFLPLDEGAGQRS